MEFKIKKEFWRKTGVYCIKNKINNKFYIGSTSVNFRHRYLQYKSAFKKGIRNQPILYKAFDKYGFENFEFNIICICLKEDCIKMEQLYIDKGTDILGEKYAQKRGYYVIECPAPWDDIEGKPAKEIGINSRGQKYWKKAGPYRNELMAQEADALIAFNLNNSVGTQDMIRRAKAHGLKIREIIV